MTTEWDNLTPVELLQKQWGVTKADLISKFHRGDWHGVCDAANDLRELEAEIRGIEQGRRESE